MSQDIILKFLSVMRDQGLVCNESIIADGKLQRFTPAGESSLTGWYVLHLDNPPSGAFGSWKTGLKGNWTAAGEGKEITPEEREILKKRMASDKKRKQREEEAIRYEAKLKAASIWKAAAASDDSHPYLKKKKIGANGARVYEGALTIPVRSMGELVGLQFIPPDGKDKRFLSGTPTRGAYSTIGPLPESAITIIICEGFATGATLFESTGYPVMVAFNAGNLEPVAKAVRADMPNAKIIIAADDDRWTITPIKNPGMHYAQIAAKASRAELRAPIFPDNFEGKPTDFNDLAEMTSRDEIKHQIETGKSTWFSPLTLRASQITFQDDFFREKLPHQAWDKNPLGTILNLDAILARISATVRYNVIAKKQEILIAQRSYSLDNYDNATFADIIDACVRFKMPTGNLVSYLIKLADLNQYNPVINWIESKPWDKTPRLQSLYNTIKSKNEELDPSIKILKEILIRRWMLSAIAAAYRPNGVSARGVLVFQGDQYLGKTKWFMSLVPAELGLAAEGLTLKTDDKDSVYQLLQYWIVELGELDSTFRKSDIAQLKSFIPKNRDTIRLPFMPKSSTFPRRTVMFGSVNPEHYLNDPTGNTRFWTIACESINFDHGLDMQQIWAELLLEYKAGQSWYLTSDEMDELNNHNAEFTTKEPVEERIAGYYDWTRKDGTWKTATEILDETGIERPTRQELVAAAATVRKLNGGQTKRSETKRLLWVPNKNQFVNPSFPSFDPQT
jgi:putative DNA primase/helicase